MGHFIDEGARCFVDIQCDANGKGQANQQAEAEAQKAIDAAKLKAEIDQ
jgi:hypothetical protein